MAGRKNWNDNGNEFGNELKERPSGAKAQLILRPYGAAKAGPFQYHDNL
jgi:hypothetical protein